jgi:hypothetical protein
MSFYKGLNVHMFYVLEESFQNELGSISTIIKISRIKSMTKILTKKIRDKNLDYKKKA